MDAGLIENKAAVIAANFRQSKIFFVSSNSETAAPKIRNRVSNKTTIMIIVLLNKLNFTCSKLPLSNDFFFASKR